MRRYTKQEIVIFTSLANKRGGYNATYLFSYRFMGCIVLVGFEKIEWRQNKMKNTLFDNYDFEKYEEIARESLAEDANDTDLSEDTVLEFAADIESRDFTDTLDTLKSFFEDKTVMFTGAIGRWCGNHTGFDIGNFDDLFEQYTKDCEYFNIYDDNGALYIRCSHHDGTNLFQVLVLTNKGARIFEDWQNYCGKYAKLDDKSIHELLLNRKLAHVPQVAKKVYGFIA